MFAAGAKSSPIVRIAAALMAGAYLFCATTDPARSQSQASQKPAAAAQKTKPGKPAPKSTRRKAG